MTVVNKITSSTSDIMKCTVKHLPELAEASPRDMQIVSRYLELASVKGKDRFNPAQVTELLDTFSKYDTKASKIDLIKDLLNIGARKGEVLSPKEITDFLEVTSGLEAKEQENVIKFMKALKERDTVKFDLDYIKKHNSYDDFKKAEMEREKNFGIKPSNETLMRDKYKWHIQQEISLSQNAHYASRHSDGPVNTSSLISKNNEAFVKKGVAGCDDPEALAQIVSKTGINNVVTYSSQDIVDLYKLSGSNIDLAQDLTRAFYPPEVKQIAELLKKSGKKADVLKNYKPHTIKNYNDGVKRKSLSTQRAEVLRALGLTGKVKMLPLGYKADVFQFGKISSGSFEQGKRR